MVCVRARPCPIVNVRGCVLIASESRPILYYQNFFGPTRLTLKSLTLQFSQSLVLYDPENERSTIRTTCPRPNKPPTRLQR